MSHLDSYRTTSQPGRTRSRPAQRLHRAACAGLTLLTALLAGCGAWQSVKDTTASTTQAIFIAKVKTMNLTVEGRAELNRDERGVSLPVALRIYQLKDAKAFETATYAQLLNDTGNVLKADALNRTDLVLGPKSMLTLSAPMADEAEAVGVVAFFRAPANAHWQLVIPKAQWKRTDPVKVSVIGDKLELEP